MTRPKYPKTDKNQAQIVEELRSLGFDVDIVSDLPGLYDIVVSGGRSAYVYGNQWVHDVPASVRVEIKSEDGLLTDTEIEYYMKQNHKKSYLVAYSTKDILQWFNGKAP